MIQVKFLGTSNANPHPDRRQSGIMIQVNEDFYLFDCGDGIASAIWNDEDIIMNNIHAVFFTHRHADHIGGLMAFLLLMHQRIKKSQGIQPGDNIQRTLPQKGKLSGALNASGKTNFLNKGLAIMIPGNEKKGKIFKQMTNYLHMSNVDVKYNKSFHFFKGNGKIYKDKNIIVESFPTKHQKDSSGFKITIGSKKIIYSGDIKGPKIVKETMGTDNYDLVIIENAHFPTQKITEHLLERKMKKLVITHISDARLAQIQKIHEDLEPLKAKCPILLASDDLIITL